MLCRRSPKPQPSVEALAARIHAEEELERRIDDTPRVRALIESWQRIRETNGIASAIEATMRGQHP